MILVQDSKGVYGDSIIDNQNIKLRAYVVDPLWTGTPNIQREVLTRRSPRIQLATQSCLENETST